MDLFEILLILVAFFVGACVQRFYNILDESGVTSVDATKPWSNLMGDQSKRIATFSKDGKNENFDNKNNAKKTLPTGSLKTSNRNFSIPLLNSTLTSRNTTLSNPMTSTTAFMPAQSPTAMGLTQITTLPVMESTQQISTTTNTLMSTPVTMTISPTNSVSQIPVSSCPESPNTVIPSMPKRTRPAIVCDCGVELINERERYNDETQMPDFDQPIVFANKILIYPISYEHYRAVSLVHPPTNPTVLSPFVTKRPFVQEIVNVLTPFKPLLHSLYYAHRHVTMLEDLVTNYQYLED